MVDGAKEHVDSREPYSKISEYFDKDEHNVDCAHALVALKQLRDRVESVNLRLVLKLLDSGIGHLARVKADEADPVDYSHEAHDGVRCVDLVPEGADKVVQSLHKESQILQHLLRDLTTPPHTRFLGTIRDFEYDHLSGRAFDLTQIVESLLLHESLFVLPEDILDVRV